MIQMPQKCLRDRNDCQALALAFSDDKPLTFVCCGHNDGTSRTVDQDEYRLCVKTEDVDEMSDLDKRDITDQVAVMAQALSIIENIRCNNQ